MPTYIMLSDADARGRRRPSRTTRSASARSTRSSSSSARRVKAQWSTLGRFDFINVVEAPDDVDDGARLARARLARDRPQYETLAAIPVDDFIASL